MSAYLYPQRLPNRRAGSAAGSIQDALLDEIERRDGRTTTLRFLYYRLESLGVIVKGRSSAQRVSEVLTELRNAGVVPFEQIIDRGRQTTTWPTFGCIDDAIGDRVRSFRIDPWQGRPRPQLWVESESLAGWIEKTAYRYAVRVVPLKGQASGSFVWEAAETLTEDTPILYLGDWDRSGRDIERAFVERVSVMARVREYLDGDGNGMRSSDVAQALAHEDMVVRPFALDVRRLAVTEEQIGQYDLPVIHKTDGRDGKTAEAVEAEALPEDVILTLVTDALDALGVDLDAVHRETERQRHDWLAREVSP